LSQVKLRNGQDILITVLEDTPATLYGVSRFEANEAYTTPTNMLEDLTIQILKEIYSISDDLTFVERGIDKSLYDNIMSSIYPLHDIVTNINKLSDKTKPFSVDFLEPSIFSYFLFLLKKRIIHILDIQGEMIIDIIQLFNVF
jgi:hypothetical protein